MCYRACNGVCNRVCNAGQYAYAYLGKKLLVLLDERGGLEKLGDRDRGLHQDADELDLLDPRVPEATLLGAVDVVREELHAAQREIQGLGRRQAELGLAARHPASLALADVHFAESADSDVVLGRGDGVD